VDESSLSTVQKTQKIFAKTEKKQVGHLTSAERGLHVTTVCCMNKTGHFVPPALIFPRKNWKNELNDDAPLGTLGIETGWMTGEVFLKWLKHFSLFVKPSQEDKVLLILDEHSSHEHVDVLSFAKKNCIVILCLPRHCTCRLQPLDVSFYGPIKAYYDEEVSKLLKANPGRTVTQYQISSRFFCCIWESINHCKCSKWFQENGNMEN
jgi:hypothetical protein